MKRLNNIQNALSSDFKLRAIKVKFKHTDTSYYMYICGLEEFLYSLKMKKYARNMIKESSPKAFKMLKIVLLQEASLPEPPTRALPWTHRGLSGPLDPSPKLVPPPKGQCLGPALGLIRVYTVSHSRNNLFCVDTVCHSILTVRLCVGVF